MTTQARFELDEYTIRVLDVVKGKFGLKTRNEALNTFIKEYGQDLVDYEVSDEVVKHFDNIVKEHEAEYGKKWKPMSEKDLDNLLGLNND